MDWQIDNSYPDIFSAKEALLHLKEKGFADSALRIFCNTQQALSFTHFNVEIITYFSPEQESSSHYNQDFYSHSFPLDILEPYRKALSEGKIILAFHSDFTFDNNTPHTNEEIIPEGPLDISEQQEKKEEFL